MQIISREAVERLASDLATTYPGVSDAMLSRCDELFAAQTEIAKVTFFAPVMDLTEHLFDALRPTDYFVTASRDEYAGEGMAMWAIRRKQFVVTPHPICYHASPIENTSSIQSDGLVVGVLKGKAPRHHWFLESIHNIYCAPTLGDAENWRARFAEESFAFFPIHVQEGDLRTYIDPRSDGDGLVIDCKRIAPELLGSPIVQSSVI